MNDNTNSVDIMALTVFKRELIDIDVLKVTVDPIIRNYLKDRIEQMESPHRQDLSDSRLLNWEKNIPDIFQ